MNDLRGSYLYDFPPAGLQKNSKKTLDTGDARITQAVLRDGIVYAAHATLCKVGPKPNESCIGTLEIQPADPLSSSTIVAQSLFGAGRDKSVWWPGIAVNAAGDVIVVAQFSGTKRFLSTVYSLRPAGGKFSKFKVLAKGTRMSGCFGRTGDYTMAAVDPSDDSSFMIAGQFAGKSVDVAFDGDCNWDTRIGVFR